MSRKTNVTQRQEGCKNRKTNYQKNSENIYSSVPTWRFSVSDSNQWSFSKDNVGDSFWTEVLPYLKSIETQTWHEVFIAAKKQNHSINVTSLNSVAQKRLEQLCIETSSLLSLRLSGKHRIYGYFEYGAFCILWYDSEHGDNTSCVCESAKKHT